MLEAAARLFAAPAAAAYLGRPGGAVLLGLGAGGGDLEVPAIVGRLRGQAVESSQGTMARRERVTLHVESSLLAGVDWLSDSQQVELPAYPGAAFTVVVDESDRGAALDRLTVARKPLVRLKDRRSRGNR